MSDGPHRSLPMRRRWQLVAERADKRSYTVAEITDALVPALEQDCRDEMSPEFIAGLRRVAEEPSLFSDGAAARLESLRSLAGSGIGPRGSRQCRSPLGGRHRGLVAPPGIAEGGGAGPREPRRPPGRGALPARGDRAAREQCPRPHRGQHRQRGSRRARRARPERRSDPYRARAREADRPR